jgi:membrane fusion protein (multidrug efflux system)
MSTPTPTAAPATMPPESVPTPAAAPPKRPLPRLFWLGGLVVLAVLAIFPAYPWWSYRVTHSITEDAFVEAHIVNVAPQAVSGHVVRFLVEENDRVKKGDILVHIDKEPFEVQVAIKKAAVEVAQANVIAARAQVRAQVAQTRSSRFKLEHAIEDVGNQIANLRAAVATLSSRRATLDLAESNLKRAEALVASRGISKEEIDTRRQAVEVAQASVAQALEQIYGIRAYLGLPAQPPKGHDLNEVPPDLDQNFSNVRQALGELIQGTAQLGFLPITWNGTPKQALAEFLQQDPEGNLDRVYAHLIPNAPAVKQAEAQLLQARRDLDQALLNLSYAEIRAPFPGIVVKRYLNLGDFASPGVAILSMYNPDLTYVTANLEEDRLPGVSPGNTVELQVDAFREPFRGRVVWINKSTGAQFALMPRNVVAGEFTKVVQRVPVRIAIEKDERWPLLRAGLSVRAAIAHGDGDSPWAEQAAREMRELETQFNQQDRPNREAGAGGKP